MTPTTTKASAIKTKTSSNSKLPPFNSTIFDRNVPNEQVEYEFFNAFKQIQVEMERLGQEREAFQADMDDTRALLENRHRDTDALSIDECGQRLAALRQQLQHEKQTCNDQRSTLRSDGVHAQHQAMYTQAMDLKATAQKLSDPTYQKALKMRGLDEKQDRLLIGMDATLQAITSKIQAWREYHNDENAIAMRRAQTTPNKIYHSCQRMQQLVNDRYLKYLQLVSQTAPELMIENLNLSTSVSPPRVLRIPTPPKSSNKATKPLSSFTSSMRGALPSTPPQPPPLQFSTEQSRIQYHRHRNLRALHRYNKTVRSLPPRPGSSRLTKYEKRLEFFSSSASSDRSYVYNSYVTPTSKLKSSSSSSRPVTVQHLNIMHDLNASNLSHNLSHLTTSSPFKAAQRLSHHTTTSQLSASCDRYKKRKPKKTHHHDPHPQIDVTSFQTKIQHTPCKSARKPQSLKRLASDRHLSRAQNGDTAANILQQKATNLEYTRTPGFGTVKRKDRRRAARFNTPPYKPPQKPLDFKEFSPEKKSPIKALNKPLSFTPNKTEQSSDRTSKAKEKKASPVKQQQTMVPKPQAKLKSALQSTHEVVGLTTTPPALEAQDDAGKKSKGAAADSSAFSWGASVATSATKEDSSSNKKGKKEESNATWSSGGGLSLSFEDGTAEDNASKKPGKVESAPAAQSQPQQPQPQPKVQWGNIGQSQNAQPQSQLQSLEPATVYKQRLTTIYQQTGDHNKLAKLLQKLDQHPTDVNWMHSLYVKICNKYGREPEPMVNAPPSLPPPQQQQQQQQQQPPPQQSNSGWFNSNNTSNSTSNQQSAWNTSGLGGNSNFGNLSDWGNKNANQSQTNANGVFSNFGGGSNSNSNQSGWNWGSSGQNNSNTNNSNTSNMSFASISNNNNQPSWLQSGPANVANTPAVDDGANAFSQFTNSGGFASLMG